MQIETEKETVVEAIVAYQAYCEARNRYMDSDYHDTIVKNTIEMWRDVLINNKLFLTVMPEGLISTL